MSPQSRSVDKNKDASQDYASELGNAFSRLCGIANYYASTPPYKLKPDIKKDIDYLFTWRTEAMNLESRLDRMTKIEFRKQVNKTKPLVRKLRNSLSKADKCNRKLNWDTFVDHVSDLNEASENLLDALDCP